MSALHRRYRSPRTRSSSGIRAKSPSSPTPVHTATARPACAGVAPPTSTRYKARNPSSTSSMRSENSSSANQRSTPGRPIARSASRRPLPTVLRSGRAPRSAPSGYGIRDEIRTSTSANAAISPITQRQPRPVSAPNPRSRGPTTTPMDPANVQRAMFCSRRDSSMSIKVACDRLTNAPDAG